MPACVPPNSWPLKALPVSETGLMIALGILWVASLVPLPPLVRARGVLVCCVLCESCAGAEPICVAYDGHGGNSVCMCLYFVLPHRPDGCSGGGVPQPARPLPPREHTLRVCVPPPVHGRVHRHSHLPAHERGESLHLLIPLCALVKVVGGETASPLAQVVRGGVVGRGAVRGEGAGLCAAAFVAIAPGLLSRTTAGSFHTEAVAVCALVATCYAWARAINTVRDGMMGKCVHSRCGMLRVC